MHIQISNVRKTIHQAVFGKKILKIYCTLSTSVKVDPQLKKHLNFVKILSFFLQWLKMYQCVVSKLHLHLNVHPGFVTMMSFLVSLALDSSLYRWRLFVYFTFPSI